MKNTIKARRKEFDYESILAENARQRRKLEAANRLSSVPNTELYLESAEMLDLFGVGVLFAPGEVRIKNYFYLKKSRFFVPCLKFKNDT